MINNEIQNIEMSEQGRLSEEIIAHNAALLSLTEIGLGSLLHGLAFPFAGQLLSLNQIALMGRLSFKYKTKTGAANISLISSLLKSLSPAGKKLTPMLAIVAQGLCYSLGLSLVGLNPIGFFLAIALSSAWAFIQPLLLIYLIFGKSILDVINYFKKDFAFFMKLNTFSIVYLLIAIFIFKVATAIYFSQKIMKMNENEFLDFQKKFKTKQFSSPKSYSRNQMLNALRDLFHPLFIFSFVLSAVFLYFTEESSVQIIWLLLRPLAVGFILFYFFRVIAIEKFINFLSHKGYKKLATSLGLALKIIKKDREL